MARVATAVDMRRPLHRRFPGIPNDLPWHVRCGRRRVASQKKFVYVIRSLSSPNRYYTGATYDVASRLCSHNAGECVHTSRHVPWELDLVIAFRDETRALEFERYLKSTSGSAFAERHLR